MDTVPQPVAPVAQQAQPTPTPARFKKLWVAGGVAMLVLALLGAGYYYYTHKPYSEIEVVALIREHIIPSVVQVRCAVEDGGEEAQIGTGLYYVDRYDGTPWVETNAHVVMGLDGRYHGCNVYFPNPVDGSFYESVYAAGEPVSYHALRAQIGESVVDGLDYTLLPLLQEASSTYPFPPHQPDIYVGIEKLCNRSRAVGQDINIGDKIYLIGYPNVGESSVTLTEGIVSGFTGQFNEWIKTSAVVNHGNSGGIAIGQGSGCKFGVATAATFDAGSNLGYILSATYIDTFISSMTGETTYMPPVFTDDRDPQEFIRHIYDDPTLGFTIGVPDEWVAVTQEELDIDGARVTELYPPPEGALDGFVDGMTIYQYATSTEEDLAYAVERARAFAESMGEDAVMRTIVLDGVTTHQVVFVDYSGVHYSMPVEGYFIIFRHKGQLYELVSQSAGPHMHDLMMLIAGMGDTIQFK